MTPQKRPLRRKLFASLAVTAGFVLIGLELAGAGDFSTGERWFWAIVGVLLIALGVAELMSPRDANS